MSITDIVVADAFFSTSTFEKGPFNAEETAMLQASVNRGYSLFRQRVAAEQELTRIEDELKQKMMEIRS